MFHRIEVATVLTVYGIETKLDLIASLAPCKLVATVLTVYGIETQSKCCLVSRCILMVATVLTVYGIETPPPFFNLNCLGILSCNSTYRLRY